jgi:hypothetical protein
VFGDHVQAAGEGAGFHYYADRDPDADPDDADDDDDDDEAVSRRFLRVTNADDRVRTLMREVATFKGKSLQEGESPALIQSAELSAAVQRGLPTTEDVRTMDIPLASAAAGITLPQRAYELSFRADLTVALVEYKRLPFKPPKPEGSVGKPRVGSSTVSIDVQQANVPLPLERLESASEQTAGGRRLSAAGATGVSPSQATLAIRLPRARPGKSNCIRDSECSGPNLQSPPVQGKCVSGRCVCPLPWSGWSCDRRVECVWRDPLQGSWSNVKKSTNESQCVLRADYEHASFLLCECPLFGSFDVLVIESLQDALRTKPLLAFNSFTWSDLEYLKWENLQRAWIPVVVLLSINAAYILMLVTAYLRSNEKEIRRNAQYYAFWREQRKERMINAGIMRVTWRAWLQRTRTQLKGQHKCFRIFFQKYDTTLVDPSAAPTGMQKATVLAAILLGKLCISALYTNPRAAEQYETMSMGQKLASMLVMGMVNAAMMLPVTVVLDRNFNIQQRMTNRTDKGEGVTSQVKLIAKQGMILALETTDTRRAFLEWRSVLSLVQIDNIRTQLLTRREKSLATMRTQAMAAKAARIVDEMIANDSELMRRITANASVGPRLLLSINAPALVARHGGHGGDAAGARAM